MSFELCQRRVNTDSSLRTRMKTNDLGCDERVLADMHVFKLTLFEQTFNMSLQLLCSRHGMKRKYMTWRRLTIAGVIEILCEHFDISS